MTKVILFDFWGTLVEHGVWSPTKQVQKMLYLRFPFSDYVVKMQRAMMTKRFETLKEAFEAVCEAFNIDCNERTMEQLIGMWNKNWMLAQPYGEIKEVLTKLKENHTLALISNADGFSIEKVLDKFDLNELFDHVFLSCDMEMLKTDEGFLKECAAKLGVEPGECLVVGDSIQSDIAPAQNAGMQVMLMDRKNKREFESKITNLAELL